MRGAKDGRGEATGGREGGRVASGVVVEVLGGGSSWERERRQCSKGLRIARDLNL